MKYFLCVILFVLGMNRSYSQESQLGNWLVYVGSKQLNPRFNLHHEIQLRNYNAVGDLEQLLIRSGIGYTFNKSKNNFLIGYGFIDSRNYLNIEARERVIEHRIFQQFISKQQWGQIGLSHRLRFEQRFVEDQFKTRFRYFLSFKIPIRSKNNYVSLYNELFINTHELSYDRNRTYLGYGHQWNSKLKTEIGYMNQFLNGASRDQINIMTFYNF